MANYLLKPVKKTILEREFRERPHPLKSSNKHFVFLVDGKYVGYIGLGKGSVQQKGILKTLFSCDLDLNSYFEIERSYCRTEYKNMPSKMLSIMIRMLKKYSDKLFVYTTGAGFQGLTGKIYQAANFLYIGSFQTHIMYIDGVGYIHPRSFNNRYFTSSYSYLRKVFPTIKIRYAPIFRYLYFLRDMDRLMQYAKFEIMEYPDKEFYIRERDGDIVRKIPASECYDKIANLKVRSKNTHGVLRCKHR